MGKNNAFEKFQQAGTVEESWGHDEGAIRYDRSRGT